MTGSHIDQLAQWYADAERITKTNLPRIGDTLITPYEAGGFGVEVEEDGWAPDIVMPGEPVRILARAPIPKPAWHDAVAVIAHTDDGHVRQVWERDGDTPFWCGTEGYLVPVDTLRDVTPLIEAKVTDEMVHRAEAAFTRARDDGHVKPFTAALHAALGLETE